MSESTFCLVFEGKIIPGQDIAEVKKRLQKAFNKDAQTIEKMFSGKKIKLKQGLKEEQASHYQAKMNSIGLVCEIEAQPSKSSAAPSPRTVSSVSSTSGSPASPNQNPIETAKPAVSTMGSPIVANVVSSTTEAGKALKLADIDKAFSGVIQKVELPATYKVGVIAMGVTMVLLPLLYVGMIATLGYGVLSHMVSNTTWLQTLGTKFGAIAYVIPIVSGVTVILFMIKPLFARPAGKSQTITLDPIKEPILFHFVNKIALAVGAPRPKQIDVDCEVNASASFRKGLFSFVGDDLVLTIGMPLLAGFNTRQLAGVLAHEFGHFSQGVGMRFHYLAYKINSWFFYSVYGRDNWDEKLDQLAADSENWVNVILNAARGGVWLTRKILYAFMMAGHAVSSYMLRQMEFDADRYEAQLAGSQQFKNTCLQLQRLGVAFQISHDYLAQAWEDKKLVNDFPALVAHNATQLPNELDKALLSKMEESKTRMYDSHPSDRERIENAMRQQAQGIFSLDCPSWELFKRFDLLSKQVSQTYYADELGLDFNPSKLVDINQVVKIAQDNEKQQEAYHAYFKDMAPVFDMPLSVNIFDTSKADWEDLLAQYKETENQLVDQITSRRTLMKKAEENSAKYQYFSAIHDLEQAGFILFPEWFDINAETLEANKKHLVMFERAYKQTMDQLRPLFEVNDRRMSIALTLLNHPIVLEANPDHAQHLKIRNHFSLLINNIRRNAETIVEYRQKFYRLASFLACVPAIGQKPVDMPTVRNQLMEDLKQSQLQLASALNRLDYPYVAEGEHQTIAEYLDPFLPKSSQYSNEWDFYIASGDVILEKLDAIYGRIISGLANVALTVDRLIPVIEGKEPMPVRKVEQVVEPKYTRKEGQVINPPEQQQFEVAKSVEAEEFRNDSRASFTQLQADVQPDAEAHSVRQGETENQKSSIANVAKAVTASHVSELTSSEESPATKPTFVVKEDRSAGTRSTFAIDESVPESVDSKPEAAKIQSTEASKEKPAFVIKEDTSSGKRSSFAIDESEPEQQIESARSEQPEIPAKDVRNEKPAVAVNKDESTGTSLTLVVDDSESEPESKPANAVISEEKPVSVIQEDRSIGTRSIFAIDESEPEQQPESVKLDQSKVSAEGASDEKPAIAVQEDRSAGTRSTFVIDESEPSTNKSTPQEKLAASTIASFSVNDSSSDSNSVTTSTSESGLENTVMPAEPVAPKSSNPFLSRSAFAQKFNQDASSVANGSVQEKSTTVEQSSQAETPMPTSVNPFLANISTYKAKMASTNSEKAGGGGATISMAAMNPGSIPASTTPNSIQEEKQDKPASFSTGGLSLEPLASEKEQSEAEAAGKAKVESKDPQSVVVQAPGTMIPTDNRQNALPAEETQQYFKSPGLPNAKDDTEAKKSGSNIEPVEPFKAQAFGSRDSSEEETSADVEKEDSKNVTADNLTSTTRPASRH